MVRKQGKSFLIEKFASIDLVQNLFELLIRLIAGSLTSPAYFMHSFFHRRRTGFLDGNCRDGLEASYQKNGMIEFLGPIFALITRLGFKAFCQGEKSPSEPEMVSGRLRI